VNVVPAGIVIAVGMLLLAVVPLPRYPRELLPQQYALLLVLIAHVKYRPEFPPVVMSVNVVLAGMVIATGTLLLLLVPLPISPLELAPQQYAAPALVSAQVCSPPALIDANVTPVGMLTATGVLRLVVVPSPSCP
jgi:hypothetical protein